ncbi:adenosine receptor A3-like [Haliotis cracherodii]|uniref:adenosine receptor A3-like n=1 Tax=Haliotis cracherodii TaxID=6455 RepID=UPI0039EBC457
MLSRDHLAMFVSYPAGPQYQQMLLGGTEKYGGQGLLMLFTILIIVFNVLLILLITISPVLRQSTKHLLILNVAVGDLLMGLLVCPLLLDVTFRHDWIFSCHTFNTLTLFRTSLVPSVTCLGLFLINVFYIHRITSHHLYAPNKAEVIMPMVLGFVIWLLSIITLVPLYFGATFPRNSSSVLTCTRVVSDETSAHLYVIFSYFPQLLCILASTIMMVYVHLPGYLSRNLLFYGEHIQVPLDAISAIFITIALYTPYFVLEFATISYPCPTHQKCVQLHMVSQLTMWLVLAKSFLVPVCWLCCREVRRALKCLCCG